MNIDEEFTQWMALRWKRLVTAAVLLGYGSAEAEDLAQETLILCYLNWTKLQRAADPDAYTYRMLINRSRDWNRRLSRRDRLGVGTSSRVVTPDSYAETDGLLSALAALDDLPEGQRAVVVLRELMDLSVESTAQVLGIAPGTVKSRLARALHGLREREDPNLHTLGVRDE